MSSMDVQGATCPRCSQFIWSTHVHDYHHCSCGYCSVDGGPWYLKISYGGDEWDKPWLPPKSSVKSIELDWTTAQIKRYQDTFTRDRK